MSKEDSPAPETLLRMAEALKKGDVPSKILADFKVNVSIVNMVRKMVEDGDIVFDGQGKAMFAQAAENEVDRVHKLVIDQLREKSAALAVENVEKDYMLGNMLRLTFNLKAEAMSQSAEEYVTNALAFYEDYKEKIEELEKGKALLDLAQTMIRRGVVTLKRLDIYGKFVDKLMLMQMRGITIPAEMSNQFWDDLKRIQDMEVSEETLQVN